MNETRYGLIEMIFSFGIVLAIGFQQLHSLSKARKSLRRREEAAKTSRERPTEASPADLLCVQPKPGSDPSG